MLKDLSLKQVNLVTTPCVVERTGDENMRVDDGRVQREEGQIARIAKGAEWHAGCLVEDARRKVGEHAAQLRF